MVKFLQETINMLSIKVDWVILFFVVRILTYTNFAIYKLYNT